jgi:hypothetical protein
MVGGDMQLLFAVLLLIAIFAGALGYLWWPANWILEEFISRLRRDAGIDKANLDKLRRKQRRQVEQGEALASDGRIAEDDVFDLPSKIAGRFERYLAFFLVLAFGLEGSVATVLLAWMGAKLIANWHVNRGKAAICKTR